MEESRDYTVGRLRGDVDGLKSDMADVKRTLAGQDEKLDQLLADAQRRKGARGVTKAALGLVTSGGFLGWIWEHFHK